MSGSARCSESVSESRTVTAAGLPLYPASVSAVPTLDSTSTSPLVEVGRGRCVPPCRRGPTRLGSSPPRLVWGGAEKSRGEGSCRPLPRRLQCSSPVRQHIGPLGPFSSVCRECLFQFACPRCSARIGSSSILGKGSNLGGRLLSLAHGTSERYRMPSPESAVPCPDPRDQMCPPSMSIQATYRPSLRIHTRLPCGSRTQRARLPHYYDCSAASAFGSRLL
jgi:hypothetical protein